MIKGFNKVTDEMIEICVRKNKDYDSAFDKSLDEDGLLVSKIRMGDKLRRFSNLIKNDAKVKDESMRDTLIDLANYAVLTIMWMDSLAAKPPGIVCGLDPKYMRGDDDEQATRSIDG